MRKITQALKSPYRRFLQPRTQVAPERVLLWWGTYGFAGRPTLGDQWSVENVARRLSENGMPHVILSHPELALEGHMSVSDLFDLTPTIRQLAWVCGPLLDRRTLRDFLAVHMRARKLALGVSILPNNAAMTARFDTIVARDGLADAAFDFSVHHILPPDAARVRAPKKAGIALRGPQKEYGPDRVGAWQASENLLRELAADKALSLHTIDTLLLPSQAAKDVERAYLDADIVLTTRMHGALLALAMGKPVIAIDQIPGGAKVTAVLEKVGWPHVFNATDVSAEALRRAYDNATSPEGLDQLTRAQERIVALTGEALERAAMAATSQ